MISISLCMIVKNEEHCLARCLDSASNLVDEIIIIDTGSTDATKDIASLYTDKIFDFCWDDDFSKARNYSFSKATCDYQMWLDADDIITPSNQEKILQLKSSLDPSIDIVTFKYNACLDEHDNPILTSTRGRLFKRSNNYIWNDPIHEYIHLHGNILYANDIFITHKKVAHHPGRNLKIYESTIANGIPLSPRSKYYFARELKDNHRYVEAIYHFEQFLHDGLGWIEDNIAACFDLSLCYQAIDAPHKILPVLLKSFEYDSPRAEITCQLGYYFKGLNNYEAARDWFLLTTHLNDKPTLGFKLQDYHNFIPHIELAVCFYKLGDIDSAIYHNEEAFKYKPQSNSVLYNRDFFKKYYPSNYNNYMCTIIQ